MAVSITTQTLNENYKYIVSERNDLKVFKEGDAIHLWFFLFIHYEDLYSAPSRLLLRSAPDPSTAEKDSFEARIEIFRVDSGMQSQLKGEPIPERGANHSESAILLSSSAGKRDHEHAPLSRAERATTHSTQGRAAKVALIGGARPSKDRQTKAM